jgi:hypothetical protein
MWEGQWRLALRESTPNLRRLAWLEKQASGEALAACPAYFSNDL